MGDPKRAPRPINAEGETVATSSMFWEAFAWRRALVPAAAFYEWRPIRGRRIKQPFAIARQDGMPLALAGIWAGWRGKDGEVLRSFAVITTDANLLMTRVHNRMPVIVEEADWPVWLGETEGDAVSLLRPAQEDVLRLWPVSGSVNNARNDGPELLGAA
jgi:putative SOS response-associated peptidase YedK